MEYNMLNVHDASIRQVLGLIFTFDGLKGKKCRILSIREVKQ